MKASNLDNLDVTVLGPDLEEVGDAERDGDTAYIDLEDVETEGTHLIELYNGIYDDSEAVDYELDVSYLEATIQGLKDDIDDLEDDNADLQATIDDLEEEVSDLETENDELQNALDEAESQLDGIDETLDEAGYDSVDELAEAHEAAQDEINDLENDAESDDGSGDESSEANSDENDAADDDGIPGMGVVSALLAFAAVTLVALARSRGGSR